jgi:hypothetical protein
MIMSDGLTTSIKNAFVLGLRESIKPSLWHELDPALDQLDEDKNTYPEFPQVKTEFPFVRVSANISEIQQSNVGRWHEDDNGMPVQDGKCKASCSIYVYAMSSQQRNRLIDAYINIIMFSHLRPSSSVLMSYLHKASGAKIDIDTTSLQIGSDSVSKGIPWDSDTYVYTNYISFNAIVNFAARLDTSDFFTISEIDVEPLSE